MINHGNPEYYEKMFDEHHSIMLLIEPNTGSIVDANKAAIDYYGFTKKELMSLSISDINVLTEEEVKREMENARKKLRDYFIFKHRRKNGEVRNVEVHSVPVDIGGRTLLFSIIFDVTKRLIQESYFNQVFENADDAIAILDDEFRIHNVNKQFLSLFQFERLEVLHRKIYEVMDDENIESESRHFEDIIQNGNLLRKETYRTTKTGRKIDVEIVAYPIMVGEEIVGVYAYYIDITKKKAMDRKLSNFTSVLDNNTEGVIVTDSLGQVQWVNRAFKKLASSRAEEVEDTFDLSKDKAIWKSLSEEGVWKGEVKQLGNLQVLRPSYLSLFSSKSDTGENTGYIGILNDISKKLENEKMVFRLAYKDSLTNLYNRAYMEKELYQRKCKSDDVGGSLSAIFIDIDKFKQINDTLGHQVGDEILREFADRLKQVTPFEEQVFRFGGDEFILLISNEPREELASKIIPKIKNIMKKPFEINGVSLFVDASIGVSTYPYKADCPNDLIKQADIAMYTAKENRRLYERYRPSMLEGKLKVTEFHNAIIDCYENDKLYFEFEPFYCFNNSKVSSYKAVLRCDGMDNKMLDNRGFYEFSREFGMTNKLILRALTLLEESVAKSGLRKNSTIILPIISEALMSNEILSRIREVNNKLGESNQLSLALIDVLSSKHASPIGDLIYKLSNEGIQIGLNHPGKMNLSIKALADLSPHFAILDMKEYNNYYNDKVPGRLMNFINILNSVGMKIMVEGVEKTNQHALCLEHKCFSGSGSYYAKA